MSYRVTKHLRFAQDLNLMSPENPPVPDKLGRLVIP